MSTYSIEEIRQLFTKHQDRGKYHVRICSTTGDEVQVTDARVTEIGEHSVTLTVTKPNTNPDTLDLAYVHVLAVRRERYDATRPVAEYIPCIDLLCGVEWKPNGVPRLASRHWKRSDD